MAKSEHGNVAQQAPIRLATHPILLEGNGHTILVLRNLTQFHYLRELEADSFKHGLPDIGFWKRDGRQVAAVESPFTGPDGRAYRIWISDSVDPDVPLHQAPPESVVPASIRPGAPSTLVRPDGEYSLNFGNLLMRPEHEQEFMEWAARRAVK
jgi:hypothetical protein